MDQVKATAYLTGRRVPYLGVALPIILSFSLTGVRGAASPGWPAGDQPTAPPPLAISPPMPPRLGAGATQQFTVYPPGTAVVWSLDGDGMLDGSGLYTAPPAIAYDHTVTVEAATPDGSRSASVAVPLLATLDVFPRDAVVTPGGVLRFTAIPAVPINWIVASGPGTIDPDGTYHAPAIAYVDVPVSIHWAAADGTGRSGGVNLTVKSVARPIRINPAAHVRLKAGESRQLTVDPPGTPVTWAADEGSIDTDGLYTAPPVIAEDHAATVTAAAADEPDRFATLEVLLLEPLVIQPANVSLGAGQSLHFRVVPGVAVSWELAGDGAIAPDGTYTAPATVNASHSVTVTAHDGAERSAQTTLSLTASGGSGRLEGDIDGDGRVSVADAILALRAATGLLSLSFETLRAADIDGDGRVTVADVTLILRAATCLIAGRVTPGLILYRVTPGLIGGRVAPGLIACSAGTSPIVRSAAQYKQPAV